MAKNKLGRGLSALLPTNTIDLPENELQSIDITLIKTNPFQPRLIFKNDSLQELAESIKENGLIQPIVVRKKERGFELISGERRLRAVKQLGYNEIPAIVKDKITDKESMLMALIENIQREDITPIEQAECYKKIMEENNLTQSELANMIGKSRPAVANTVRLLDLSLESKEALEKGQISEGHARKLLQLNSLEEQNKVLYEIINENMTVREVETKIVSPKAKKSTSQKQNILKIANTKYKIYCKKNGEKGSFVITFQSEEDFNNIIKALQKI